MKVSVVVAAYNGERFVSEQLESIKDQTRQPDEVIICDDRSTDQTAELIADFIKHNNLENWHFFTAQNNQGYQKNFYNLLKKATGDIIFLADQDDKWDPNKISIMTEIMEKDRSIKSLNSLIRLIDGKDHPIDLPARKNFYNANFLYSERPLQKLNNFSLDDIIKRNISPGCSTCITKELRDVFVAKYNFELPHDWFLNLLASGTGGCRFLNESLMAYRMHGDNTLGVSSDWSAKSKVRSFEHARQGKIRQFKQLSNAFEIVCQTYDLDQAHLLHIAGYLRARLRFSKKQSLGSLLRLWDYPEYRQTATIRGKAWDLILACHLNKLVYLLVQK